MTSTSTQAGTSEDVFIDPVAENLGIEHAASEEADTAFMMSIREDMLNMHGTCHGGMIFTLAAIAAAFATARDTPRIAFAPSPFLFLVPSISSIALSMLS